MSIDRARNSLMSTVDVNGHVVNRWKKNEASTPTAEQVARIPDVRTPDLVVRRPSSADIARAVEYYSSSGYIALNAKLRTGSKLNEEQQFVADTLDAALATAHPSYGMEVYRGIDAEVPIHAGMVIEHAAYCSTSDSHRTARAFAGDDGTVLEIEVPAGVRCLDVDGIIEEANPSEDDDYDDWGSDRESETLFGRGTRIEILSEPIECVSEYGDRWRKVRARLLPSTTVRS